MNAVNDAITLTDKDTEFEELPVLTTELVEVSLDKRVVEYVPLTEAQEDTLLDPDPEIVREINADGVNTAAVAL